MELGDFGATLTFGYRIRECHSFYKEVEKDREDWEQ